MAKPIYEKNPDGTYTEVRTSPVSAPQSNGYHPGRRPQMDQDGDPSLPPQARGKAAALDAYLAQGGTPFKHSGRYKKGPNKGKNYDEAKAKFETMWASAPDAVKEKYASRSQHTDLAPSEKRLAQQAQNPATGEAEAPAPVKPPAVKKTVNPNATAGAGRGTAKAATPAVVPTPTPAAAPKPEAKTSGPSFEELTEKPQAFNANASVPTAGPDGKIHDVGDGSTKDGAMANQGDPKMPDLTKGTKEEWNAYNSAMKEKNKSEDSGTSPIGKAFDFIKDKATEPARFAEEAKARKEGRLPAETKPAPTASTPSPTAAPSPAAAKTTIPASVSPSNIADPTPGKMPAPGTTVTSGMPTDERMHAEGKTNVGGVPVEKAPLGVQTDSGTGKTVTPDRPKIKREYDYEAGEGKELTGMVGGRKTYSPVSAPMTSSAAQLSAADRALSSSANVNPRPQQVQNSTRPTIPRGPASQEANPMSYKRPVGPVANQDTVQKHANAMERQHAYGADPELAKETQGIYNGADEMTKIKIAGQVSQRAKAVTDASPVAPPSGVTSRVTATRPATPEESRTGKVATPVRPPVRQPQFARR